MWAFVAREWHAYVIGDGEGRAPCGQRLNDVAAFHAEPGERYVCDRCLTKLVVRLTRS